MISDRYSLVTSDEAIGGQGKIDLYKDGELERIVAVKTLHASSDSRRLQDEIAALGALSSNNVVQVFDVNVQRKGDRTEISLVLEYVEGSDLTSYIGEHVTLTEALRLLFQLANALVDVHGAGITHRDVKPENAKVDREGTLKLYDFGLARFYEKQNTVGIVGTPGFMAPELRKFGSIRFTPAVDTFAFAITAWCILSEEPDPPSAEDFEEIDFSSWTPSISDELASALNDAIAEDPDSRPKMSKIRDLLLRELTRGLHRAVVVASDRVWTLDSKHREASLSAGDLGSCDVVYDGYDFYIEPNSGSVFINNRLVSARRKLTGSMLITLGDAVHREKRHFVSFNVSHPEIPH